MYYTTIQKWGNSNGLRIPKSLLEAVGIRENDRVEIAQTGNEISIKKAAAPQHRTLENRLTAFYGKTIEQIDRVEESELDWGGAKGAEVW